MKPQNPSLTAPQVKGLVQMIGLTRDREFNCSECLEHVSEYAEHQMTGQELDAAIACIEQHLKLCPECREEYEALLKILRAGA